MLVRWNSFSFPLKTPEGNSFDALKELNQLPKRGAREWAISSPTTGQDTRDDCAPSARRGGRRSGPQGCAGRPGKKQKQVNDEGGVGRGSCFHRKLQRTHHPRRAGVIWVRWQSNRTAVQTPRRVSWGWAVLPKIVTTPRAIKPNYSRPANRAINAPSQVPLGISIACHRAIGVSLSKHAMQ